MVAPLKTQKQALDELWSRGLSGARLLENHSRLADEFIRSRYGEIEIDGLDDQVAVVALGGYGRQELFPFSDIDVMILFRPSFRKRIKEVADGILYPLWDTGYEVGHGVRTIRESLSQVREDFVFQVAMLDARLIVGSQSLFDELIEHYHKQFVEGRRDQFVESINRFSSERRERFGSHGYLLEPNIKESKGGLRDIQTMVWSAQVVFGINSINGIVEAGFLLESEGRRFEEARNMLIRIRNRLHYISGRKNDQLFFEQQEEMSTALGYQNEDHSLGVERFMRDVYGHLRTVAVIADLFADHINEVLGLDDGKSEIAERVVEDWIEIRRNRVHLVARSEEIRKKPHLLIRVFLASSRFGLPLHHRAKMTITEHLGLITDKVRASPRMAKPFLRILSTPDNIIEVMGAMLETGILAAYIPEFGRINTLAQHDVYHIYTVDRHLIQAVAELHRVVGEEPEIASLITRKKPFFLAALLHDIGKNSGLDHSEYGADLMRAIGERLGLDAQEVDDLSFLVLHHLFIPENALRRDLNDTVFIQRCAETIKSVERLAMLYLLSIADSQATGPSAWSEWKATLMRDMYLKVDAYLAHIGDSEQVLDIVERQHDEGVAWLREQLNTLVKDEQGLRMDIAELSADYLNSFTPEAVAHHLRLHRDHYRVIRQKALAVAEEVSGHWSILVMAHDNPGLLAKICGVMTLHNLIVVNAQIFTWADDTVVDVIDVLPAEGVSFDEYDWDRLNEDLDKAVTHRIGIGYRLYEKLKNSYGRKRELTGTQDHLVLLDNEGSEDFTIVEVHAADLPGQLYQITQTLADLGVNIHKAFIATEVGQLIDVFYVLDRNGDKIIAEEYQRELENGLLHAIGGLDSEGQK